MKVSDRVSNIADSITLKLNAKAVALKEAGHTVYNLTAGQLPFMPASSMTEIIKAKSDILKSYQYSPAAGFPELRKKIITRIAETRNVDFSKVNGGVDAIVSNGAKSSLFNALSALLNPGDEVIVFAPYWVSYSEIIKINGGVVKVVSSSADNGFIPDLNDFKNAITDKTKVVLVNSPNNPSGVHYPKEWMKELASILVANPNINIISDEIYFELAYMGDIPTYVYQYEPELLNRTVIIEGISKTFACTGLRVGYMIAPKQFTTYVSKLQAQIAAGTNSLIQLSLESLGLDCTTEFLKPINEFLRENAKLVKDKLDEHNLSDCFYQTTSAFYFMVDYSKTPIFASFNKEAGVDYGSDIASDLLEKHRVVMVPGTDFGIPNAGRISLVLQKEELSDALDILFNYLNGK